MTTDAFGAKVEEYRTRLGLPQKELAGKVGLSPSHLNRIEKGTRKRPGVETVRRMIKALRLAQSEAKELVQLANLSPLVLQQDNFKEKRDVKARGNKDAGAEESGGGQSVVGQLTQNALISPTSSCALRNSLSSHC
jgi:transcriptional regulator with XRE-family HTH domain